MLFILYFFPKYLFVALQQGENLYSLSLRKLSKKFIKLSGTLGNKAASKNFQVISLNNIHFNSGLGWKYSPQISQVKPSQYRSCFSTVISTHDDYTSNHCEIIDLLVVIMMENVQINQWSPKNSCSKITTQN